MVPVKKDYFFQSTHGRVSLEDLFGSKSQLIVYHFMFELGADEGCQGCAFMAANFPDLRHLADKDTALVVISRAPIEKIAPYKEKNFWKFPRMSSNDSDYSYDFHVTLDEKVAPVEYNFERQENDTVMSGEQPGLSVFKLEDGQVYHTYSTYSRLDNLAGTYVFLDFTPAGRLESPQGPADFKTPAQYDEGSSIQ
jgi:predicted dithiol-disulfide oxidoreductase (DUF899 family)